MCDCYHHKCENCNNKVNVHIGDFCIEPKDLHILCPKCSKKLIKNDTKINKILDNKMVNSIAYMGLNNNMLKKLTKETIDFLERKDIKANWAFIDIVTTSMVRDRRNGWFVVPMGSKKGDKVIFWSLKNKVSNTCING
ncbi:MAG: hypothetical protein AABY32_01725 [Nanoarchaeota archaeon]